MAEIHPKEKKTYGRVLSEVKYSKIYNCNLVTKVEYRPDFELTKNTPSRVSILEIIDHVIIALHFTLAPG